MPEETPATETAAPKPSFRDRLRRDKTENTETPRKSAKDRAKDVAAVIGLVTVAGVVAGVVTNRTAKTETEGSTAEVDPTEDN